MASALVGVSVRATDYSQWEDQDWQAWRPLLDWEITLTYADDTREFRYCETETGAHLNARRYIERILPIAGIAS